MRPYFLIFVCLLVTANSWSQNDCVLGVGVTEDETIIQVFQLNEAQKEQMVNFSAELKYRIELLENQAENMMKRHPQSTADELKVLASKYSVLRDSMEKVQTMIDKRVLRLFNEKQYRRYLQLCSEAYRQPLRVIPKNYQDSIPKN